MPLTLRADQRALMQAASAQFRAGERRVLIQAPTGFGKTVLTSSMNATAAARGFRSIFIVHRRELLAQSSLAFSKNGVPHGIIAAGVPAEPAKLVQKATIGTLARQIHTIQPPRFVCFDECHHLPPPGWTSIQEAFGNAFHIGLSATLRDSTGRAYATISTSWCRARPSALCRSVAPYRSAVTTRRGCCSSPPSSGRRAFAKSAGRSKAR